MSSLVTLDDIALCSDSAALLDSLRDCASNLLHNLSRMAAILRRLDELGVEVTIDHALLPYIRLIAQGRLSANCLLTCSGEPLLLDLATRLSLPLQERVAANEPFKVLEADGGHRMVPALELSKRELSQVFQRNSGRLRTDDEQRHWLEGGENKSKAQKALRRTPFQPSAPEREPRQERVAVSDDGPLAEAIAELARWRERYGHLPEVQAVVEAMADVVPAQVQAASKRRLPNNTDDETAKRLVEENMKLVGAVLSREFKNHSQDEELFGAGVEGLMRAAQRFDASKGFTFSTYAYRCIYGRMLVFFKRRGREQKERRESSLEAAGLIPATHDTRESDDRESAEAHAATVSAVTERLLSGLHPRLQEVLRLRGSGLTLQEIADKFGLSRARIQQLEERALTQVRANSDLSSAKDDYEESIRQHMTA